MGLAICIGMLADLIKQDEEDANRFRATMSRINEVLIEKGLPAHREPEELPPLKSREAYVGHPYSDLHYLRRFYAHVQDDPDWVPTLTPDGEDPARDPVVVEETEILYSHLLCHSDCDGFYLPIQFENFIVDSRSQNRIPGGVLGSSYHLLDELTEIASKLGVTLNQGQLSDAEAQRIKTEADPTMGGFWREKAIWLSLFEAARLSIEYKTAICFA
jgi:hypothetical protein